jgi:hypothetical protein
VWYCDVFIFLRGYDAHYLIGTFEVVVALFLSNYTLSTFTRPTW